MMSALECFEKARQCDALARACLDPLQRSMLRETAQHWRTLGKAARAAESRRMPSEHRDGAGVEGE